MMIDQAPERERGATRVAFMGRPAWVDLAPALVAMRARVPLVVVLSHRCPDGTHQADLAGVIEPPPRPERAWAEAAMRQATELARSPRAALSRAVAVDAPPLEGRSPVRRAAPCRRGSFGAAMSEAEPGGSACPVDTQRAKASPR